MVAPSLPRWRAVVYDAGMNRSKWAARPQAHRTKVLAKLATWQRGAVRRKNAGLAKTIGAAIAALTVRPRSAAKPASSRWKLLSVQLASEDAATRAGAIAEVVAAVKKVGGVERGAAELGVHHRTLFLRMAKLPELGEAVRAARAP